VLLLSITFQLISGFRLLTHKLARTVSWIDSLQVGSAIYLLLFFLSHLTAVLKPRYLRNVDTNWRWASDGLLTDAWTTRLSPYYFLAVIVVLNHGRSMQVADQVFYVVAAAGAVLSAAIMMGMLRG
jgi:hypothetical protein